MAEDRKDPKAVPGSAGDSAWRTLGTVAAIVIGGPLYLLWKKVTQPFRRKRDGTDEGKD